MRNHVHTNRRAIRIIVIIDRINRTLTSNSTRHLIIVTRTRTLGLPLRTLYRLRNRIQHTAKRRHNGLFTTSSPRRIATARNHTTTLNSTLRRNITTLVTMNIISLFRIVSVRRRGHRLHTLRSYILRLTINTFRRISAITTLNRRVDNHRTLRLNFRLLLFNSILNSTSSSRQLPQIYLAVSRTFITRPTRLTVHHSSPMFAVFSNTLIRRFNRTALNMVRIVKMGTITPFIMINRRRTNKSTRGPFVDETSMRRLPNFPIRYPGRHISTSRRQTRRLFTFARTYSFTLHIRRHRRNLHNFEPLQRK